MNWMTSGKHRALRSRRGQKKQRQMQFPAHVQRMHPQRPPAKAQPPTMENDGDTPWMGDIRMLEFAREAAGEVIERKTEKAEDKPSETTKVSEKKTGGEGRCVFTPTKTRRKTRDVRRLPPPPPSPSVQSLLLFNNGEAVQKNKRSAVAHQQHSEISKKTSGGASVKVKSQLDPSRYEASVDGWGDKEDCTNSGRTSFFDMTPSDEEMTEIPPVPSCVSSRSIVSSAWMNESTSMPDPNHYAPRLPEQQRPFGDSRASSLDRFMKHGPTNCQTTSDQIANTYAFDPRFSQLATLPSRAATITSQHDMLQTGNEMKAMLHEVDGPAPSFTYYHADTQEMVRMEDRSSSSSQESLVLPPPMGWQQRAFMPILPQVPSLRDPRDLMHFTPPHQDADKSSLSSASSHLLAPTLPDKHLFVNEGFQRSEIGNTAKTWTMSSRTQRILSTVVESRDESSGTKQVDKHMRALRKARDVAIYMYTLVQCYRIDDEQRSVKKICVRKPTGQSLAGSNEDTCPDSPPKILQLTN
ncbi:hypothetical protein Poli38472_010900 [Pythium oligandrum]|uniref:Uncharacterized protein n=1 Tax=Pythium oligandrum TaxID=41045 RepID=A0A8K1CEI5_PYTOL|nr:hypothetical protein Poli38472_010900 [Pythium oligandrum]|eukprot:TMW61837.1 hypothetical protein Poli38472_010900 [Pythium oligandrum]